MASLYLPFLYMCFCYLFKVITLIPGTNIITSKCTAAENACKNGNWQLGYSRQHWLISLYWSIVFTIVVNECKGIETCEKRTLPNRSIQFRHSEMHLSFSKIKWRKTKKLRQVWRIHCRITASSGRSERTNSNGHPGVNFTNISLEAFVLKILEVFLVQSFWPKLQTGAIVQ